MTLRSQEPLGVWRPDADHIRRGRSFAAVCRAAIVLIGMCILLVPLAHPEARRPGAYLLGLMMLVVHGVGALLARRWRVDAAGLLVSVGISVGVSAFSLYAQSYNPVLWLLVVSVTVAGVAARPWWVWGCLGLNLACVAWLALMLPADPHDPYERGGVLAILVILLITVSVFGHLNASYNRALFVAQRDAIEELERAQRALASTLQEVQLAHAQARRAAAQADLASRAKSTFLANMSHELRTPLNAILGYAELIQEDTQEQDVIQDLQKIQSAGQQLLTLINDVLDLSKVEAGHLTVCEEPVELTALIDQIAQTAAPLIQRHDNTLHLQVDPTCGVVYTDRTRLRQILLNLLSNAAKFTRQGQITLNVHRDERGLRFEVVDTGIGMSPQTLEKLFQAFVQADESTTRRYGGTGLGLALSQRLAGLLGGQILAQSVLGQGSTLTLILPTTHGARAASPQDALDPLALVSTSPDVLVVDDDPAVCEFIRRQLERDGRRVLTSQDGDQGLELARRHLPSLIILDLLMPGTDGWQFMARMRTDPSLANTPVLLTSVLDEPAPRDAAAGFLAKPISSERLLHATRALLCPSPPADQPAR